MTQRTPWLLIAALALYGCSKSSGPSCSLDGGSQLAATTWPKFRADTANTGRACMPGPPFSPGIPTPGTPTPCVGIDLSGNSGIGQLLLPQSSPTPAITGAPAATSTPPMSGPTQTPTGTPITQIGPVETTPIIGPDGIFVASSDGNVYVLDFQGQPVALPTPMQVDSAITGSPLLGVRPVEPDTTQYTLFVPSNSLLSQFDVEDGTARSDAAVGGFVAASPNIWNGDGTTFVTSLAGSYEGVCPNGVARYVLTFPPSQSTVAIVQDPNVTDESTPIIVAGGLNGQVRAFNLRSRQSWSFFASADISAAILIDESTGLFYVADRSGRIFAGAVANGLTNTSFSFKTLDNAPITASLALGRDGIPTPRLYAADERGRLYARDRATGKDGWDFDASACVLANNDECVDGLEGFSTAILSSPAVAVGGAHDIVVFGVDVRDVSGRAVCGFVCAVVDEGPAGSVLWSFPTGAPIGTSSPSIGPDGTVYIGSRGGVGGGAVYAIGP